MFTRLPQTYIAVLVVALTQSRVTANPCDIYASGGTQCVAAQSTIRALYSAFDGALYNVIRGSDNSTMDIMPLSAGGIADSGSQDDFCASTTCLITTLYDQSGNGNHLTRAPAGAFNGPSLNGDDDLASAIGAPVTVNGQKAYGVFISPGTGYRIDSTTNIPTGNDAQGIYAVFDGTHYNDNCCFDYGNAETSNTDTGNGHMEAIYFGNCTVWDTGAGTGPWIMADLENGLFSSGSTGENSNDPSQSNRFVTSVVKGEPDQWAIRGGAATTGDLTTYFSGARPSGYEPMHLEGSLILGIGGDNSNGAQGTFYEGAITAGYPSDDTENQVQADVVAAGYATTSLTSGPSLTVGDSISLQLSGTNLYLSHNGSTVVTAEVSSSSSSDQQQQASWTVQTGLGNSACFSFESVDSPGSYIRHYGFQLMVDANGNEKQFFEDATFCPESAFSGDGNSVRSWSYPTRWFRVYGDLAYVASNGGVQSFDDPVDFNDDASFNIQSGFAS